MSKSLRKKISIAAMLSKIHDIRHCTIGNELINKYVCAHSHVLFMYTI
jgi:hypothetical protein